MVYKVKFGGRIYRFTRSQVKTAKRQIKLDELLNRKSNPLIAEIAKVDLDALNSSDDQGKIRTNNRRQRFKVASI